MKRVLKEIGDEALKAAVGFVVVAVLTLIGTALVRHQAGLLTSGTAVWSILTRRAVPLWLLLAVVVVAFFGWLRVYRNRGRLQLFVVWEPETTHWGEGKMGNTPLMQIVGSALFSNTDPKAHLLLSQAYLDGTQSAITINPPIEVKYGMAGRRRVDAFVKPVIGTVGKPFTASLIFLDQFNRPHRSPPVTFAYVGPAPTQSDQRAQTDPDKPHFSLQALDEEIHSYTGKSSYFFRTAGKGPPGK